MNILSRFMATFHERRRETKAVKAERRGMSKLHAANSRLNNALDDLNKTLSMSRADFNALLAKEAHLESVKEVGRTVQFDTFYEICEFRYEPEKSLMRLCKNPEHEAAGTGIASCNAAQCPKCRPK